MTYVDEVLTDSPKAFWKCQEASGTLVDSSGNGLDLSTVTGTPVYQTAGPYTSDYAVRCPGGAGFNRGTLVSTVQSNFTIEMWVMVEAVTANDQTLIYQGNSGANGWGIVVDTNRTFQYLCGGVALGASSSGAIGSATFTHIAVKRAASQWTYYVNGSVDTANAGTTNPGAPSGTTTRVINAAGSAQGRYAYIAIYESALSDARVAAHYAASAPGTSLFVPRIFNS